MYINDTRRKIDISLRESEVSVSMPPSWILDRLAEEKRTGGYTPKFVRKHGACPVCFTVRSANGTCNCP